MSGIFTNFKVALHKTLTSYKGGKNNFTVEKAGRYHVNPIIKMNINNGIN